jgi:hypothetical protein
MSLTTTVPTTIEITRRRLWGLIVAIAAAAAVVTWALIAALDPRSDTSSPTARTRDEVLASLSPAARAYVEGIEALSPLQLAAGFGTDPVAALGLTPETRQRVEAIAALSPEELAAAYGTGPTTP